MRKLARDHRPRLKELPQLVDAYHGFEAAEQALSGVAS